MDYPKMLYRAGGGEKCHGLDCETLVANDEQEEAEALADGYAATPQAAHGGEKPKGKQASTAAPDPEIKVLEAHIAKLEGLIEEANKRITDNQAAADKAASEAAELLTAAEAERDAAIKRAEAAEASLAGKKIEKAK